MRFYIMVA